jgi:hypothetical protein
MGPVRAFYCLLELLFIEAQRSWTRRVAQLRPSRAQEKARRSRPAELTTSRRARSRLTGRPDRRKWVASGCPWMRSGRLGAVAARARSGAGRPACRDAERGTATDF